MDKPSDITECETISSYYICRICENTYNSPYITDCSLCNNKACVMLFQEVTLEEALEEKRKQYGYPPDEKDNLKCENNEEEEQDECIELKHLKYKSMVQGGTRKDIGGRNKSDSLNTLDKFLQDASASNNAGRWNRLDKTIKLQKMAEFAEIYAAENNYTPEDKSSLMAYLRDCLDKKKLIRVKDVEYDNENDRLISIPGLQYNRTSKKHTIKNADSKRSSVIKSLPQRKTVKLKREPEK